MPKCYSVRLNSLVSISDKCYLATAFDGSEALIPKSQVFGQDYDVSKSDAYWISEWILEKKELQYSRKKTTIFTKDGKNIGYKNYKYNKPEEKNEDIKHDESLFK